MSSESEATQLVLLYQASASNTNWTSIAVALLVYDYALTFSRELQFVWSRSFSAATVLFLLNRYAVILLYFVDFITLFPILPQTCHGVGVFIAVLEILPYIIWAGFSSLRAYALSNRNRPLALFIFLLSLVPAGVNAYFLSTFSYANLEPPANCTSFSTISADLSKTLTIVSRTSLMGADVLVIGVTWWSTYRIGRATQKAAALGPSFGTTLLRDGTIYFFVLLAMNIVQLVLNTVTPNSTVQQASYVSILENPIASILISRFILNLREIDQRMAGGGGSSVTSTLFSSRAFRAHADGEGTLRFARSSSFVGALGAPLDFGSEDQLELGVDDATEGYEMEEGDSGEPDVESGAADSERKN